MDEDVTQTDEFKAALEEAVEGLKAKNSELLGKVKEANSALKAYDGIDPDEYKALVTAREEAEAERAKSAGDWEKREAAWKKKLSEKDSIIADQDKKFRDSRKQAEAALAIGHHKGNEKLLLANVLSALDVDEEYNVYATYEGDKISAQEYVGKLKADKDYAGAFPGAGVLGSGARPSESGTSGLPIPEGLEIIN